LEQISKMEQISKLEFFFENGTTFKLKQFKKWSKLRISNLKFRI
jgi:hypothetical protein